MIDVVVIHLISKLPEPFCDLVRQGETKVSVSS